MLVSSTCGVARCAVVSRRAMRGGLWDLSPWARAHEPSNEATDGMRARRVQMRKAIEADAGAIAAVHLASMQEAYRTLLPAEVLARIDARDRTERWREHLAGGTTVTMLAEVGGEPVGFAAFGSYRDEEVSPGTVGEVMAIYVHPAAWGRGIGSALMREALDRLRSDGFADVLLWVIEGNRQAIEFYERFGFVRDGSVRHREIFGTPTIITRLRLRSGMTTV
jgi:ribosomal protein S18 acetylase RimI-like enzyme